MFPPLIDQKEIGNALNIVPLPRPLGHNEPRQWDVREESDDSMERLSMEKIMADLGLSQTEKGVDVGEKASNQDKLGNEFENGKKVKWTGKQQVSHPYNI